MNCLANFATLIVNAPDFSRMAKTKNSAIWSQLITIPLSFSVTCLIGVLISSASTVMYGETYWNPLDVLSRFLDGYSRGDRAGVFLIAFGFAIAQLGTNISANSISAGTDMTALLPKYLNIRRGGFICACIGYAICPWNLMSSSSMFTTYLSAYSVFLSSIAGVVFSDYFLVKRGFLYLPDLYSGERSGAYAYSNIYCNYRAYAAYICGIAPNITGFVGATKTHVVPLAASRVYQLSYFVGFLSAALVYFLLCWLFPIKNGIPEEIENVFQKGWYEQYKNVENFDEVMHGLVEYNDSNDEIETESIDSSSEKKKKFFFI
ncbi:unnamed protein product [[Candida] boidinii]|nr:unnamed protein product [[Candida] boidinii]